MKHGCNKIGNDVTLSRDCMTTVEMEMQQCILRLKLSYISVSTT